MMAVYLHLLIRVHGVVLKVRDKFTFPMELCQTASVV
jgi:hypothetical protein